MPALDPRARRTARRRRRRLVTRALIGLTLRYLWLATVDDLAERHNRLQRLQLTWARDRAILGEELIGLGYMPDDEAGRESVAQFRARADQLERDGIGRVVDREIALQLDRELEPATPRIFELMYALIYRVTSDVAHYGIGTALAGYLSDANRETVVTLDQGDEERAALALGLALSTYVAFLDFTEPIIRHGCAADVDQLIGSLLN